MTTAMDSSKNIYDLKEKKRGEWYMVRKGVERELFKIKDHQKT